MKFDEGWLSHTYAIATALNGVVAVVSGVLASFLADSFGFVSPFMLSLVLLVVGTLLLLLLSSCCLLVVF